MRKITKIAAEKYGNKPALIFNDSPISFEELNASCLKLANVLKEKGVSKGDKVAICLPNCPEYVYSYLACFFLGAVVVPLDFMLKSEELISCLV